MLEVRPTTLDVGICTPLPGTPLWETVFQSLPDGRALNIEGSRLHTMALYNHYYCSLSGRELERKIRDFYRRFYLRPAYLWQRAQETLRARDWKSPARAGLNIFRFLLS
jgi:hypothetical protein